MPDSNFAPLATVLPEIAGLGRRAEESFAGDPRAAMSHLRLFGERLAVAVLEAHGQHVYSESQFDRLQRLRRDCDVDGFPMNHLHTLRKEGNRAVHGHGVVGHADAIGMLRAAHRLSAWYWRQYSKQPPPPPGPFVKPVARDRRVDAELIRKRLAQERKEKEAAQSALDEVKRLFDMPEVATHHGIQASFDALPAPRQEQVAAFLKRFREEPIHQDWPLRSPEGMADDKVRFVDVDALVVTVIAPARGDLLLLVHIGSEAESRAWANTKRFEVNPVLGTLQVYDAVQAEALATSFYGGLFDDHSDETLVRIGLPPALFDAVRAVADEGDLDELAPHLPPEAADALYLLAAGHTLSQTLRELDRERPPEHVDEQDFAVAVHHPESRRSFALLGDEQDLEAVLAGSIEAWRVYLHPEQHKYVKMKARGPIRLLGGAGTGKTVALLHRARHLANGVFGEPTDRLLVTTFTKNLAADLRHQLAKLVDTETLKRFDCVHLHAYAAELWRAHGDGRRMASDEERRTAWGQAMKANTLDHDQAFYEAEWERIVQAQDLDTELGYLRARREGRGVRLHRGHRRAVWAVFEEYRSALEARELLEWADQLRLLRTGLEQGRIPREYVSLLCDEVQDFAAPELMFMRALVETGANDLFFVGDAHQRIYGHEVRMSACGIAIRGRARRLRVNYRTTARVRQWAVAALKGERFDDLDGGEDTLDGYRSLRVGEPPAVHLEKSRSSEDKRIVAIVRGWLEAGPAEAICVSGPTNRTVSAAQKALEQAGIDSVRLQDTSEVGPGVRAATFFRMKGLEFPRVLLVGVREGLVPLRPRDFYTMDDEEKALWDRRQRCLLYVAATRARDELAVTAAGAPSPFLVDLAGAPSAPPVVDDAQVKSCPRCGESGPIAQKFGYRRIRRTNKEGVVTVTRAPQSYCTACRTGPRER